MIRKLLRKVAATSTLLTLLVAPVAVPAGATALQPSPAAVVADSVSDACAGIGLAGGNCGAKAQTGKLNNTIAALVNVLSAIVGVAAVIMVVIGGFKFVTSAGDSNKVASARSTIIYAIIGLVVVAMAQVIVHFVIQAAS